MQVTIDDLLREVGALYVEKRLLERKIEQQKEDISRLIADKLPQVETEEEER